MPRKREEGEDIRRDPFSPAEVGRITRMFYGLKPEERVYHASKQGHQFELRFNPVKKLVWWRLCIDRAWVEGEDSGVFQALRSIGTKIFNKDYDRRLARMAEPVT